MRIEDADRDDLIQRYASGECSPEEIEAVGRAIEEDEAFARRLVREVRMLTALRSMMKTEEGARALPGAGRRRLVYAASGIAAALAAAVLLAVLLTRPEARLLAGEAEAVRGERTVRLMPGDPIREHDTVTAVGIATCRLWDASTVKLDDGSSAVLTRGGWSERARLVLRGGRLFVRVTESPGTFVVSTSSGDVEVLGTVFGVAERKGLTAVSIYHGRVAVRSAKGELVVAGGNSAQVSEGRKPVLTEVDPNQALRWARESAEFRHRALGEIVEWIEANSKYRIDADPALLAERITITIPDIVPMIDVIAVLGLTCDAEYTLEGNAVELRRGRDG
jgi:ferric-dicitrate binding protein FerR (iron transport regulator)